MTPKQFFVEHPTPYKKKGWPDDMQHYVQTFDTMDEWWQACLSPKDMVLVLKTLNYCEEIWKFPVMKCGLEKRDYSKRQTANEKCCDRIRRKVVVKWHRTKSIGLTQKIS